MIDFADQNWAHIRNWAENEIKRCREKNDADLEPAETARLRGKIAALKELLALPAKAEALAQMQQADV